MQADFWKKSVVLKQHFNFFCVVYITVNYILNWMVQLFYMVIYFFTFKGTEVIEQIVTLFACFVKGSNHTCMVVFDMSLHVSKGIISSWIFEFNVLLMVWMYN